MIKNSIKTTSKLCSGVPNIHIETDFSNATQERVGDCSWWPRWICQRFKQRHF